MGVQPLANHSELTPLRFLQRSVEVYPSREAVVHGARTYSYAQFGAEVQQFARALAARIRPGDRVAVLAPNIPEMLFAHYAVPLAGGVLVALNTRLSARELGYIMEHSETKLLFADTELLEATATAARPGSEPRGAHRDPGPRIHRPQGRGPGRRNLC